MDQVRDPEAVFAGYVATLGRGPGRSRALTRDEARDALAIALRGACDPHQLGAFLMLLRYRGEDADEIAGLVEAGRDAIAEAGGTGMSCDLDWPSYGAGRTRGAPWFLLAALALADAGHRVLMHGTNEFTGGITVERGLAALGRRPVACLAEVGEALERSRFAYVPASVLAPRLAQILSLRRLLGLRSPVNTVCRLLDPGDARASVDGVFHPPYIEVHLGAAARLGRRRLLVLKGGGGEAERAPFKPLAVHVHDAETGRSECVLPALAPDASRGDPAGETGAMLEAVWRGEETSAAPVATVIGTIAIGLLALDRGLAAGEADRRAARVWEARLR